MSWTKDIEFLSEVVGSFLYISYISYINPKNTKLTITCLQVVRMTSYSHRNTRSWRETFSETLVEIRHDDVTWRHFPIFCQKSADVSKKSSIWVTHFVFFEYSYIRPLIWGVNHFSTISGSRVIVFLVNVGFSMTWSTKMPTSAKIMTS